MKILDVRRFQTELYICLTSWIFHILSKNIWFFAGRTILDQSMDCMELKLCECPTKNRNSRFAVLDDFSALHSHIDSKWMSSTQNLSGIPPKPTTIGVDDFHTNIWKSCGKSKFSTKTWKSLIFADFKPSFIFAPQAGSFTSCPEIFCFLLEEQFWTSQRTAWS